MKRNGALQRTHQLYYQHRNMLPVVSDDREMSVSNSHPITFNHYRRPTLLDESQIAQIEVENCWRKTFS